MIMSGVPGSKAMNKAAEQRPGSSNDGTVDDAEHEVDDVSENKPKKKRRIIKTTDKKYECPTKGCGKSYSRAEHLYRHQLNHTPKRHYNCDFPGCDRYFVRADLCARHRERHTAKGSHLQRKDAFMNSQRTAAANSDGTSPEFGLKASAAASIVSPVDSAHPRQQQSSSQAGTYLPPTAQQVQPYRPNGEQHHDQVPMPSLPPLQTEPGVGAQLNGAPYSAYQNRYPGSGQMMPPPTSPATTRRYSMDGQQERPVSMQNGYGQVQQQQQLPLHPPPMSSPAQGNQMYAQPSYPSTAGQPLVSAMNGGYTQLPSLPAFQLPQSYSGPGGPGPGTAMSPPAMSGASQYDIPPSSIGSMADFNNFDQFPSGYAMAVFGGDGFNHSPQPGMGDAHFIQQLFETGNFSMMEEPSPPGDQMVYQSQLPGAPLPKFEPPTVVDEQSSKPENWEENISPTINGMDLSMRECIVTEKKQARLIAMVRSFDDVERLPGRKCKEDILAGDTDDDNHPLSVNMLKTYITSYWLHTHQQMPIMHRPTFNPETCPDLLLLAMSCLGACCLERTHAAELIKNCAELAFFCAHHIRWEVFKDAEFRPTAKLWTFQTMLLLELFEKMYSTRDLHERAHIHHATTLTVMRRGSSLIGRAVIETPSGSGAAPAISGQDPTRTPPGPEGTVNTSGVNTPDAWWNRWITVEATKRVAFAAFIIDSTHATLFGHAAVMSPHDIRLQLPCDEALWSATSSAEVRRTEASLLANGIKPTMFMEGLKKCLAGQKVRTPNVFNRVILMAGLLNYCWQLSQRDESVKSLGVGTGNSKGWQSTLRAAFDHWRNDFDESLSSSTNDSNDYLPVSQSENKSRCHKDHRDNVFESNTCLHSLAHMAMHIAIVDCEMFAGAPRSLGREVTDADRAIVRRNMCERWAPSATARDAVFHALRFLCEVLLPQPEVDEEGNVKQNGMPPPLRFTYSARDDYLLNRPWILYYAVMIVWSYGYALDGPLTHSYNQLNTRESQILDMHHYLTRVGGVARPDDLESLRDRNSCLGLLILLRECFSQPRWELMHEAGDMLQRCIDHLLPQSGSNHSQVRA